MSEEQFATISFGLSLMAAGGYFLWTHWKSRSAPERTLFDQDEQFVVSQFRLRSTSSLLMVLVGILICVSLTITDLKVAAYFWLGVMGLVGLMVVTAFYDMVALRKRYQAADRERQEEQQQAVQGWRDKQG